MEELVVEVEVELVGHALHAQRPLQRDGGWSKDKKIVTDKIHGGQP